MSRTYNEHHPTSHNRNNRFPSPYLDKDGTIRRRRRIKAYGSKGWCGIGEVMLDVVDKKKERRNSRKYRK